jgi:hypothetical protein
MAKLKSSNNASVSCGLGARARPKLDGPKEHVSQ